VPPIATLVLRSLLVVGVTLAAAVCFLVVGLPAWAWARECGGLSWLQRLAFFGPGVACILRLDHWIVTRRLTFERVVNSVLLTAAAEWVLGLLFFATQWGC
jgi:hypothetical protein